MEYVAGFLRLRLFYQTDRVVLLRKLKPAWQAGLLNGVGGKVESSSLTDIDHFSETPEDAMTREWMEETLGLVPEVDWKPFAVLRFVNGHTVHFFSGESNYPGVLNLHGTDNDAGERFEVLPIKYAIRRGDLIPNLKWLIPLAFLDTCDQVVEVKEVSRGQP